MNIDWDKFVDFCGEFFGVVIIIAFVMSYCR